MGWLLLVRVGTVHVSTHVFHLIDGTRKIDSLIMVQPDLLFRYTQCWSRRILYGSGCRGRGYRLFYFLENIKEFTIFVCLNGYCTCYNGDFLDAEAFGRLFIRLFENALNFLGNA